MTVEEIAVSKWLNRAYYANNKINALIAEREYNIELATKTTPSYDNIGAFPSISDNNSAEQRIFRICESNEKINREIDNLVDIKKEITDVISKIQSENDDLDAILRMHYLGLRTWEQVAEDMNWSERTVKYKHIKALQKICDLHCIALPYYDTIHTWD